MKHNIYLRKVQNKPASDVRKIIISCQEAHK